MIDFKFIVKKIQTLANQRGYAVDTKRLEDAISHDELRLRRYKQVFATKEGNWVLNDLMKRGGLLSSVEADTPSKLAYLEGKRNMAIHIASSLGLNFEQVIKMYSDIGEDRK